MPGWMPRRPTGSASAASVLPEFGARLRQTAAQAGILSETDNRASDCFLAFLGSLAPLTDSMRTHRDLPIEALRQPLYLFALFLALHGIEIDEALDADLLLRELAGQQVPPLSTAPIPDEGGVFRDKATGRAVRLG